MSVSNTSIADQAETLAKDLDLTASILRKQAIFGEIVTDSEADGLLAKITGSPKRSRIIGYYCMKDGRDPTYRPIRYPSLEDLGAVLDRLYQGGTAIRSSLERSR